MRKLIILAALAVCCMAAPSTLHGTDEHTIDHGVSLQRPSPISPDIPSDPKPAEKITVITDPKELAKHKRETSDEQSHQHIAVLTPTVQPHEHAQHQHDEHDETVEHHRQKRDHRLAERAPTKKSSSHNSATKKANKRSPTAIHAPAPARDLPHHRQRRDVVDAQLTSSNDAPPLIYRNEGKLPTHSDTHTGTPATDSASAHHHQPIAPPALARVPLSQNVGLARPQTLQALQPTAGVAPTVRPQTLPALSHELPVSHDSHTTVSGGNSHTAVKRDIPVPLVPKYHHPEETPNEQEKHAATEQQHNKQHADHKGEHPQNVKSSSEESDESAEESKEKPQHTHEPHLDLHPSQEHTFQPAHPHAEENKVSTVTVEQTAADTSSTPSSSSTNTEQPIIRHYPVPVAELFARPKQ